jgi:ribosome-binding protein aMBF1 (putative translation factor)
MRCTICKRTSDEVKLLEGIYGTGMVHVCHDCAEKENIPTIKKPSDTQLEKADEQYTVRERMERMSGMRDTTEISDDQIVTQGNLAKLRMPAKKEQHEDVLDNYYWTLNISRRRKKLSIGQLAEQIQIEAKEIKAIEHGKIPANFEELFLKLEAFLGIKLLKNRKQKVTFTRNVDEEKELLNSVRNKMDGISIDKAETLGKIEEGEVDFSHRDEIQDVTLNDLVEMKKKREHQSKNRKTRIQTESMLGDDIDLDIEEL